MLQESHKQNLKQTAWKMAKLQLWLMRLVEEEEEEEEKEEEEEEEQEEEELCKHWCTFMIYMVKKTHKPNLKQIPWKMAKLQF